MEKEKLIKLGINKDFAKSLISLKDLGLIELFENGSYFINKKGLEEVERFKKSNSYMMVLIMLNKTNICKLCKNNKMTLGDKLRLEAFEVANKEGMLSLTQLDGVINKVEELENEFK